MNEELEKVFDDWYYTTKDKCDTRFDMWRDQGLVCLQCAKGDF